MLIFVRLFFWMSISIVIFLAQIFSIKSILCRDIAGLGDLHLHALGIDLNVQASPCQAAQLSSCLIVFSLRINWVRRCCILQSSTER